MPHVDEGAGSPFRQPPPKARNAGSKRQPGRLFFGYFLLAKQKKVSRPRVRLPDQINRRGSDTLLMLLGDHSRWASLHSAQPSYAIGALQIAPYRVSLHSAQRVFSRPFYTKIQLLMRSYVKHMPLLQVELL
jgi:hypothetical protein